MAVTDVGLPQWVYIKSFDHRIAVDPTSVSFADSFSPRRSLKTQNRPLSYNFLITSSQSIKITLG